MSGPIEHCERRSGVVVQQIPGVPVATEVTLSCGQHERGSIKGGGKSVHVKGKGSGWRKPLVEGVVGDLDLRQHVAHCLGHRGTLHHDEARHPTRGVDLPSQQVLAPRQLSEDQRYILRSLVEQAGDRRGAAIFALGYWVGCRVSDVSWLQMIHTHVGPKVGWLHVGYKGGKWRDIDLMNEARKPLYEYLKASGDADRIYVFTSQRSERLTEEGIHHWFRTLKAGATKDQWELIHDLPFHDLRHDFAHRAREVGWSLEEVAYYLGHVTKKGTPAIQTTVRYTQVSREQVKEKLKYVRG
jgi:site-specific recombinase XerD